jgi:D-alanyl-D-alanine carboxypeptidase
MSATQEQKSEQFLLRKDAVLTYRLALPDTLKAPVKAGEAVGAVICYADDEEIARYPVITDQDYRKLTFAWCAEAVFRAYFP